MAKMKGVVVVNTERCKGFCTAGSGRHLQRMLFVRHCVPGRMSHRI